MQSSLPSGVIAATDATDVANRALDSIAAPAITDLYEGSAQSKVVLRHYTPTLLEILRAAPWNFARKMVTLFIVGDATGSTPNASTTVPQPWLYEYLLPPDCVKARFVPWTSPPIPGTPPIMTNLPLLPATSGLLPAPFVIGQDFVQPEWGVPEWGTEGWGAQNQQTVVLTNVAAAMMVYTAAVANPDAWDPLFSEAFVQRLAAKIALAAQPDKKLAIALRNAAIAVAKDALGQARVVNGNESWTTTDHVPDFLAVRGSGGWPAGFFTNNIPGTWGGAYSGYDSLSWLDGSAY